MASYREEPELGSRELWVFPLNSLLGVLCEISHSACLVLSWLEIKPLTPLYALGLSIRVIREQRWQGSLKRM